MKIPGLRGFSLLEILLVLTIIATVLALVTPAALSIGRGSQLSQASQSIAGQLELARQTAITRNRQVEVRFYRFADSEVPGQDEAAESTWVFQALQSFEIVDAKQVIPLQKVRFLPEGTVVDSGPKLSSLFDPAKRPRASGSDPLPRVGTQYEYVALRFRPDGSTDLPPTGGPWFLTLHSLVDGDLLTTPPANFVTIQIDSVNGALQYFRPG